MPVSLGISVDSVLGRSFVGFLAVGKHYAPIGFSPGKDCVGHGIGKNLGPGRVGAETVREEI